MTEKRREYLRKWRARNRVRIRRRQREYRARRQAEDPSFLVICAKRRREWYERNRERLRAEFKERYATDAEFRAKILMWQAQGRERVKRDPVRLEKQRQRERAKRERIYADPERHAAVKARSLADWHRRKATADGAIKEAQRREYKRRRYHEVYKRSPEYMARKQAYDRAYYNERRPDEIARSTRSKGKRALRQRGRKGILEFF